MGDVPLRGMAWRAGFEQWDAGDVYTVRELLDHRNNVSTGALEFLVKWEDQPTVDADTGERVVLQWSLDEYNSWEPADAVPQGMKTRFMAARQ